MKREPSEAGAGGDGDAKRVRLSLSRGGAEGPSTFADDLQAMAPVATKASAWRRRALPDGAVDPQTRGLSFQWIDIDMYDGAPLARNPKAGEPVPGLVASSGSSQNAAIIRLYGVTEEGHSVLMHVHGVLPYFYVACPDTFDESRCGEVRQALDAALAQRDRGGDSTRVVGVQLVSDRMSIYGYQFDRAIKLWKVYLSMPSHVPKARTLLESGITLPGCDFRSYQTYESNVPFILRFMIDQNIQGCNWLEAPAQTYSVRSAAQKISLCQIEIDIVYNNIVSHAPEGKWSKLAPFRILSFDIECMGRKGHFPEAEKVRDRAALVLVLLRRKDVL